MSPTATTCFEDEEHAIIEEWTFNWLTNPDGEYDLRKAFLYCDKVTGKWTPRMEYSYCD